MAPRTTKPAAPPAQAPAAPEAPEPIIVQAIARGTLNGQDLELRVSLDVKRLIRFTEYLHKLGLRPPLKFELTADNQPICPKHRVPMRKREKQGDEWHSHKVMDGRTELFCRGYEGPDSPGYDVG